MAEKTKTLSKPELEREYVIPLREKCRVVPRYKKANKAIKTIKEFVARHMKVENRDLSKVKIDSSLNEEVWARGIKKPPPKVRVKVRRVGENIIVTCFSLSKKQTNKIKRLQKRETKAESTKKKPTEKLEEKVDNKKDEEKKKDTKEKTKSSEIQEQKLEKQMAKQAKHTIGGKQKQPKSPVRKVLND